jgi:hypothetical protein
VDRSRLRYGVRRDVDEGEFEEGAIRVSVGQEPQGAFGEAVALQCVGTEREMRTVHLEGRAGDHDQSPFAIDLVELCLGEGFPATDLRL